MQERQSKSMNHYLRRLWLIISIIAVGLIISISGCGGTSDSNTLVGRWEPWELSESNSAPDIEFFNDGTGRSFDEHGNELIIFTWETGSSTLFGADDILIVRNERNTESRGTFEINGEYLKIQWALGLGSGLGRSHHGTITYRRLSGNNVAVVQQETRNSVENNQPAVPQHDAEIYDISTPIPEYAEDIITGICTMDWVTISLRSANISIPPTWIYYEDELFGDVDIFSADNNMHMFVGWIMVGDYSLLLAESVSSEPFLFDDMHMGYMLEFSDSVLWLHTDLHMNMSFFHNGNSTVFFDNEELIITIARTLTMLPDVDTMNINATVPTDWISIVSNDPLVSVSIPSTWTYHIVPFDNYYGPGFVGIIGEVTGDLIQLYVWEQMVDPETLINDFPPQEQFKFDDGHTGYILAFLY